LLFVVATISDAAGIKMQKKNSFKHVFR